MTPTGDKDDQATSEHNTTECQSQENPSGTPPVATPADAQAQYCIGRDAGADASGGDNGSPGDAGATASAMSPVQANGQGKVPATSGDTICPGVVLEDDTEVKTDDPPPSDELFGVTKSLASSELLKPVAIAIEELYSTEQAKANARIAIEVAYSKAATKAVNGKPVGKLRDDYYKADEKFISAAGAMKDRVLAWIHTRLGDEPGSLKPLLDSRLQVESRLRSRAGPRELKRDAATSTTKQWQKAYANWSKPGDTISAIISEYADKIHQLSCDINAKKNADLAIYTFWFEVASKHLQLRDPPEPSKSAVDIPGLADIEAALKDYPEFANTLKPGWERGDGSVFLIDPAMLPEQRENVLKCWRSAAEEQAKREAAFKLRPDDAGSLKTKRDALIQSRAAAVKALLEDPIA